MKVYCVLIVLNESCIFVGLSCAVSRSRCSKNPAPSGKPHDFWEGGGGLPKNLFFGGEGWISIFGNLPGTKSPRYKISPAQKFPGTKSTHYKISPVLNLPGTKSPQYKISPLQNFPVTKSPQAQKISQCTVDDFGIKSDRFGHSETIILRIFQGW